VLPSVNSRFRHPTTMWVVCPFGTQASENSAMFAAKATLWCAVVICLAYRYCCGCVSVCSTGQPADALPLGHNSTLVVGCPTKPETCVHVCTGVTNPATVIAPVTHCNNCIIFPPGHVHIATFCLVICEQTVG